MAKKPTVKKGGSRGNLGGPPPPEKLSAGGKQLRLRTPKNLRALLADIMRVVHAGAEGSERYTEDFLDRAKALGFLAQVMLKTMEQAELEKRVAELERIIAARSEGAEGAEVQ